MPPKRNKTKNTERKLEKIEKLTPKEAVLDYQIGNLRVSISRLKFKKETLRNALIEKLQILSTLKMEGENLIKETSSKILNSSAAQESSVSSDVTKTYLLETWKIRDEKEKEVKEVEEEIRLTQSLTKDVILELRQWQTYADNTKRLNDTRIQMLEKEYNNMKKRFQSMIEHLTDMRNHSDQDLHTKIENASESIRNSAVENMVNTINKTFSHQMLQNKFLKIENKSLADRIEQISSEVSELQEDNLLAVREIFETKLPHVLLPLSFSDNQVTEADDLHTSKILDLGMSQKLFDFKGQHESSCENDAHGFLENRKYRNVANQEKYESDSGVQERLNVFHYASQNIASEIPMKFQTDIAEYFTALGPLEQQAIFLQGLSAKIDRQKNFNSPKTLAHLKFNPDIENWPIDRNMLLECLSRNR